jgi:DNA repair protein RAD50
LQADIEDRKARLEKLKADVKTANYEERLTERTIKGRKMDDKREELNTEIRTLGLQADARAKLALKTTELKAKNAEVKNMCVYTIPCPEYALIILGPCVFSVESHSSRFRVLVGVEASPDSMEQELDQALL